MKEAEKLARIEVVYAGLEALRINTTAVPGLKTTRANLFQPPRKRPNAEHLKVLRKKEWQRDCIQRLVDAELLEKVVEDGQEFYVPLNAAGISELLSDHNNYGLRLSKFIFPKEAGLPQELLDKEEEAVEEPDSDEDSDEDSEESEEEDDDAAALLTKEAELVKVVGQTARCLIDQSQISIKLMQEILAQYEELNGATESKEETQAQKEFQSYIKNRFKEMDEKLISIDNRIINNAKVTAQLRDALASYPAIAEATLAKVTALFGFSEENNLVSVINNLLATHFTNLKGRLDTTLDKYLGKLTNAGLVRDSLAELRLKIKDLKAVEDLAIKVIEATETNNHAR